MLSKGHADMPQQAGCREEMFRANYTWLDRVLNEINHGFDTTLVQNEIGVELNDYVTSRFSKASINGSRIAEIALISQLCNRGKWKVIWHGVEHRLGRTVIYKNNLGMARRSFG